jgi:hypothetical protein
LLALPASTDFALTVPGGWLRDLLELAINFDEAFFYYFDDERLKLPSE